MKNFSRHLGPLGLLLMVAGALGRGMAPEYAGFYHLDEARLAGTWMYSPDFKDEWVSRRLKWQAWTIHL